MDPRTRRSPARFLAPLALIAVIVALFAVVSANRTHGGNSGVNNGSQGTQSTQAGGTTTTTSSGQVTTTKPKPAGPRHYIVKVGDNLSTIADKTGVPVETLQTLNPNVDPHAMTAGQKIRLR